MPPAPLPKMPLRFGREGVEQMPDGTAGKAVYDRYAKSGGGASRIRKFRCSAGAHAFRGAVSPDVRRKNGFVALVNKVAHRLTDQVIADRPDFQAVFCKQIMPALAISVVRQCLAYLEMISPTGQFEAVVSPLGSFLGERFQGHVGPLSCK